eukprot:scaffold165795_cov35-Prasinocladus_malaysianus.AAC.2
MSNEGGLADTLRHYDAPAEARPLEMRSPTPWVPISRFPVALPTGPRGNDDAMPALLPMQPVIMPNGSRMKRPSPL